MQSSTPMPTLFATTIRMYGECVVNIVAEFLALRGMRQMRSPLHPQVNCLPPQHSRVKGACSQGGGRETDAQSSAPTSPLFATATLACVGSV